MPKESTLGQLSPVESTDIVRTLSSSGDSKQSTVPNVATAILNEEINLSSSTAIENNDFFRLVTAAGTPENVTGEILKAFIGADTITKVNDYYYFQDADNPVTNDYRIFSSGVFLCFERYNGTIWEDQFQIGGSAVIPGYLEILKEAASGDIIVTDSEGTRIIAKSAVFDRGMEYGDLGGDTIIRGLDEVFKATQEVPFIWAPVQTDNSQQYTGVEHYVELTTTPGNGFVTEKIELSPVGIPVDNKVQLSVYKLPDTTNPVWRNISNEELEDGLGATIDPTTGEVDFKPNFTGIPDTELRVVVRSVDPITLKGSTNDGTNIYMRTWDSDTYKDAIVAFPLWKTEINYAADDKIWHDRDVYICNTAGIQTGDFASNASLWDLMSLPYWEKSGSDLSPIISSDNIKLETGNIQLSDATITHENITHDPIYLSGQTGLDDLSSSGIYSLTGNAVFQIKIDGVGSLNTFEWRKGASGGWTSGIDMTGSAQLLQDGISITWAATTGHSNNDEWEMNVGYEVHISKALHVLSDITADGDVVVAGTLRSLSPLKIQEGIDILCDKATDTAEFNTSCQSISLKINDVEHLTLENDGTISVDTANYEDLVTSDNDIPNKKYVDDNDDIYNLSTGRISGGLMSVNVGDNTLLDLTALKGLIVDSTTDIENPSKISVNKSAVVGYNLTMMPAPGDAMAIFISIDSAGNIIETTELLTNEQRRDYIELGLVGRLDTGEIIMVIHRNTNFVHNPLSAVQDFFENWGAFNNSGNKILPYDTDLRIKKEAGSVFCNGVNTLINGKNPYVLNLDAQDPVTAFGYKLSDGTDINLFASLIDPDQYDDGTSTLATVPAGKYTVQRLSMFPEGKVEILYGQKLFNLMSEAKAAVEAIGFIIPPDSKGAIPMGYVILKSGTTNLSDDTKTAFFQRDKRGNLEGVGFQNLNSSGMVFDPGYINHGDGSISVGEGVCNLFQEDDFTGDMKQYNIAALPQQTGYHMGGNGAAILTDLATNFPYVTGMHIYNITDGSSGLITANTEYTITATLSGGTENDWDTFDTYIIKLANNDESYVTINYNNNSPRYEVTTVNSTTINESTVLPLYSIYRTDNDLHVLEWGEMGTGLLNKLHQRFVKTQRFAYESGVMLDESATRIITTTSGLIWLGGSRLSIPASNSSTDPCEFWHHASGVWIKSDVTTYNNMQYDDGTDLQPVGNTRFGVNWIYISAESNPCIFYVLGSGSYTLVEAVDAPKPNALPDVIATHGILVGRIIIEQAATSATQIDSAFEKDFAGGGGGGVTTFIGLTDTPADYVDQAGKFLTVNSIENGLIYADVESSISVLSDSYDARFFAELGLPDLQTWTITQGGAAVISIFNDTIFGVEKDSIKFTTIDVAVKAEKVLTADDWNDILTYGASYSGVVRFTEDINTNKLFSGMGFSAANDPRATSIRSRVGVYIGENGVNTTINLDGQSVVTLDGTGDVPDVPIDTWFAFEAVVNETPDAGISFGAVDLYVNGILIYSGGVVSTSNDAVTNEVSIANSSATGTVTFYVDNFGVTIYQESPDKTLSVPTMGTDNITVIIPPGQRDYTITLPDDNPRRLGNGLNILAANVGGSITLASQVPAVPQILFNGLNSITIDIIKNREIIFTNTVENGNVYQAALGMGEGTATGQIVYWDNVAAEWKHTETDELYWDDENKRFNISTVRLDTDGISSAPALGWSDTGLYRLSANTMGIAAGTDEILRFTNAEIYASKRFKMASGSTIFSTGDLEFGSNNSPTAIMSIEGTGAINVKQNPFVIELNAGEDLAVGEVVMIGSADLTVIKTITAEYERILGVVETAATSGNPVKITRGGIITIKITGTVTRNDFLATDAVFGTASSTGTAGGQGDFAIALEGGTGGTIRALYTKTEIF